MELIRASLQRFKWQTEDILNPSTICTKARTMCRLSMLVLGVVECSVKMLLQLWPHWICIIAVSILHGIGQNIFVDKFVPTTRSYLIHRFQGPIVNLSSARNFVGSIVVSFSVAAMAHPMYLSFLLEEYRRKNVMAFVVRHSNAVR